MWKTSTQGCGQLLHVLSKWIQPFYNSIALVWSTSAGVWSTTCKCNVACGVMSWVESCHGWGHVMGGVMSWVGSVTLNPQLSLSPLKGVDFTASNETQGTRSFGGRSLHSLDPQLLNPYQKVVILKLFCQSNITVRFDPFIVPGHINRRENPCEFFLISIWCCLIPFLPTSSSLPFPSHSLLLFPLVVFFI